MKLQRKASHTLVCGRSGMGKTSYGERAIVGSHHGRVFIFDHQGEFALRLHLIPARTFDEMRERAQTERIVAYDYAHHFRGHMEFAFDAWCDEVFGLCEFDLEPQNVEVLAVCDELQKCCNPNLCPQPLKNILQTGRRYALDSLWLSQQPNRLPNELREQVTELVLFQLQDENSLKFVKYMGKNPEEIQALKPLEYKWFQTVTGEERTARIEWHKAPRVAKSA